MTESRGNCRNCDAPLAGEYCAHCGQRERGADLTFGQFAGELADELFSWDSRLWRTLVPLLFRPGFLTAEFIAGRRARYVPPFRLYLIISFVLILVVTALASNDSYVVTDQGLVIGADTGVAADQPDPAAARKNPAGENSPPWLKDLDRRLQDNARRLQDNPAALIQPLLEYLPQMMFLLLPFFALLLQVCYLFSPYHYLQHLVFSLHFHSFAYVLYLVGVVAHGLLGKHLAGNYLLLLLPLYLPIALMRTYGSAVIGALGTSLLILLIHSVVTLAAFSFLVLLALAVM